jgi:excisionase family DNA binding protein
MSSNDNLNATFDKMLTVDEIANLLSVHSSTIRRWEREGLLKSYRVGPKGFVRFMKSDLTSFIGIGEFDNVSQH